VTSASLPQAVERHISKSPCILDAIPSELYAVIAEMIKPIKKQWGNIAKQEISIPQHMAIILYAHHISQNNL